MKLVASHCASCWPSWKRALMANTATLMVVAAINAAMLPIITVSITHQR